MSIQFDSSSHSRLLKRNIRIFNIFTFQNEPGAVSTPIGALCHFTELLESWPIYLC